MAHAQNPESASTNRRDTAAVLAGYATWLVEQPLSARTREASLAAVTALSHGSTNATRDRAKRSACRARVISPPATTSAT